MINYTLKLYPTSKQKLKINEHIFHLTGVYNTCLKKLDKILDLEYSYVRQIQYLKST